MKNIKKISIVVVVFLITYLVFLVILAPANKVIGQFKLPKDLHIQQISGAIWSGKAEQLHFQKYQLNRVRWTFNWSSLLTFKPSVDIEFGGRYDAGPMGSMQVSNFGNELTLTNVETSLSANEIMPYLNLPIDLTAQGQFKLTADEFVMGKPLCSQLSGVIAWPDAQINSMEQDIALGTLQAQLGCENGAITVDVAKDNRLGLEFTAYIAKQGRLSGQGYIIPGAQFPEQIKPVLGFIGKPDKQGRYKIKIKI